MTKLLDFYCMWAVAWFGIIGTIVSIYAVVLTDKSAQVIRDFMKSTTIEAVVTRAFRISFAAMNFVFGQRIWSMRAFVASFLSSLFLFILGFLIAIMTTDWLKGYVYFYFVDSRSILNEMMKFASTEFNQNPDAISLVRRITEYRESPVAFVLIISVSLVAEYIYICKSRLFLKFVRADAGTKRIIGILAVDIATTFLAFAVISSLSLVAMVWVTEIVRGGLNLREVHVDLVVPLTLSEQQHLIQEMSKSMAPPYAELFSQFSRKYPGLAHSNLDVVTIDLAHPFDAVLETVIAFFKILYWQIRSIFSQYYVLNLLVPVPAAQLGKNYVLYWNFEYPVTTLLATAFLTNIWFVFTAMLVLSGRAVYAYFTSSRRLLLYLHDRPQMLIPFLLLSFAVMFSGFFVAALLH
jgi:hypothetical protein